jgi:acetyl esterase
LPELGGDASRVVLAGDSSGGNLVLALALGLALDDEHAPAWARRAGEAACGRVAPRALVSACGFLHVSDPQRRHRAGHVSAAMAKRISRMSDAYLRTEGAPDHGWADPIVLLEDEALVTARPLPPCFAPVGLCDPLLDDTRRLGRAFAARGASCDAREYEGGIHGFHFLLWTALAKRCWRDTFRFLDEALDDGR